jgi:hypothetical protein
MPSVGIELPVPATQRTQTYSLDREDTGIGLIYLNKYR